MTDTLDVYLHGRLAGRLTHEALQIERYDREYTETGVRRIHQEDFCQALGLP